MNGAQITMIILFALSLGCNLAKHGEYRTGKHNFWISAISAGIEIAILAWGGFWA